MSETQALGANTRTPGGQRALRFKERNCVFPWTVSLGQGPRTCISSFPRRADAAGLGTPLGEFSSGVWPGRPRQRARARAYGD